MTITRFDIITALLAAENSLGDARSLCCTDEIPDLHKDSRTVKDLLTRLESGEPVQ